MGRLGCWSLRCALFAASLGTAPADDWPMARHDMRNTAHTSDELAPPMALSWRVKCGAADALLSSGGTLCAARSAHGEDLTGSLLTLLDAATGRILRQVANHEPLWLKDDLLVLAAAGKTPGGPGVAAIECRRWRTWQRVWSHDLGIAIPRLGGAVEKDGILFVSLNYRPSPQSEAQSGVPQPAALAIRLADGSLAAQRFAIPSTGETYGNPALDGGLLFAPVSAWGVAADVLALRPGDLGTERTFENAGTFLPIRTGRYLITQRWSLSADCTDVETGKRLWSYRTGRSAGHCLAAGPGGAPVAIEPHVAPERLAAIRLADGKVAWEYPLSVMGFCAGSGRYVYAGGTRRSAPGGKPGVGGFYCVDATTGRRVWQYERPGFTGGTVIVSGRAMYAIGSDGFVYRFGCGSRGK